MRVAFFSTKPYDRRTFEAAAGYDRHLFSFFETRLGTDTASLAADHDAVCAFVNDTLDGPVLERLHAAGVRWVLLRCAGFNHVDIDAAGRLGLTIARVPSYSPEAVAEHTLALTLALLRNLHRAYNRTRDGNFSLQGLMGTELAHRPVGVIGTGAIGQRVALRLRAFEADVSAFDVKADPECEAAGVVYKPLEEVLATSEIVTLHCPLNDQTRYLIDEATIARMPRGTVVINTSRGGLIHTSALIEGLKSGRLGGVGIDVYEEEDKLFFEDRSDEVIQDDAFARLLTFPNVIVTGHQAFLTDRALRNIAETTLGNLDDLAAGRPCPNRVPAPARVTP